MKLIIIKIDLNSDELLANWTTTGIMNKEIKKYYLNNNISWLWITKLLSAHEENKILH